MPRWLLPLSIAACARRSPASPRRFSTIVAGIHHVERVSVPCGTSGNVYVDLHNVAKVSSSEPLMIYLPPFSTAVTASTGPAVQLPKFCHSYPTAVIHYRWTSPQPEGGASDEEGRMFHPGWPAPIHDTLTAYTWLAANLGPTGHARRDIYVYGSYLGASLATALALTETHPHQKMACRGCIAYNGIYNWTTFLPDHPINKPSSSRTPNFLGDILAPARDPAFDAMRHEMEELFTMPQNLFDPFASPCLFFHTPGLLVPPSFGASAIRQSPLGASSFLPDLLGDLNTAYTAPRKSPLGFPPRQSTLKIPETLLLFDSLPPLPPSSIRRRQRRTKDNVGNSFRGQAEDLANLMRRSINKIELKERMKWDVDWDGYDVEAKRRVRFHDVGPDSGNLELNEEGDGIADAWLEYCVDKL
ncbi:hypothetical protein GGR56DRAFT_638617 [Xylariaceae sp. FL0804]|nr:hypothetical protein GGR56DRAFT_638617 [Xylariaceae sp. FL0804]